MTNDPFFKMWRASLDCGCTLYKEYVCLYDVIQDVCMFVCMLCIYACAWEVDRCIWSICVSMYICMYVRLYVCICMHAFTAVWRFQLILQVTVNCALVGNVFSDTCTHLCTVVLLSVCNEHHHDMPVYVYVNKHMLVAFTQGLLVNARRLGFFSSFAFHESTCA